MENGNETLNYCQTEATKENEAWEMENGNETWQNDRGKEVWEIVAVCRMENGAWEMENENVIWIGTEALKQHPDGSCYCSCHHPLVRLTLGGNPVRKGRGRGRSNNKHVYIIDISNSLISSINQSFFFILQT